jgi:hypothetical protein
MSEHCRPFLHAKAPRRKGPTACLLGKRGASGSAKFCDFCAFCGYPAYFSHRRLKRHRPEANHQPRMTRISRIPIPVPIRAIRGIRGERVLLRGFASSREECPCIVDLVSHAMAPGPQKTIHGCNQPASRYSRSFCRSPFPPLPPVKWFEFLLSGTTGGSKCYL